MVTNRLCDKASCPPATSSMKWRHDIAEQLTIVNPSAASPETIPVFITNCTPICCNRPLRRRHTYQAPRTYRSYSTPALFPYRYRYYSRRAVPNKLVAFTSGLNHPHYIDIERDLFFRLISQCVRAKKSKTKQKKKITKINTVDTLFLCSF